jgi:hypothetical protein
MVRLLVALVASALCFALLTVQSTPAHAAEQDVPSVTEQPCADAEAADARCVLRLRQPLADTHTIFGEKVFLGQTFVAPQGRTVCKVDLLLTKNINVAFGDPVLAQIQTLGGVVLDSTFIPSGIMPLGVQAWQTFNFGCDGDYLVAGKPYRLVLFSRPNTPRNAFQWHRHTASVIPGLAEFKYDLGAFSNIAPVGTDFAFRLYMCY